MAVITKTVPAAGGDVTVTGAKPFARSKVVGNAGGSGAFIIVDAQGVDAQLTTPASPGGGVEFANTDAAIAETDAILAAVNA